VTAACQHLIDDFLKPRFLPTIRPTQFNYPVDILGKWHGTKYRFIQRYRSGFPENLGEEFDAPFARLDWISRNRFRPPVASPHRRNGSACNRNLTLAEAIDTLRSEGLFHPFWNIASSVSPRYSPDGYRLTALLASAPPSRWGRFVVRG